MMNGTKVAAILKMLSTAKKGKPGEVNKQLKKGTTRREATTSSCIQLGHVPLQNATGGKTRCNLAVSEEPRR